MKPQGWPTEIAGECPLYLDRKIGLPRVKLSRQAVSALYIEFVGPVLNFMGLKKTDSAPILRTPVGEVIWHTLFSVSKERGGELVSSQYFRTVRRPWPHSAWRP